MSRLQLQTLDASSLMIDPVSEQEMITSDLCEEEQSELVVDSKEQLIALCKDYKLKINKHGSGDGVAQLIICDHHQQLTDLDTKITQCIYQNNETHSKLDGFRKTLYLLLRKIGMEERLLPYDDYNTVREDDPKSSSGVSSKFDLINCKISKCISSNKLAHLKIDNLQKLLDMILKNLENDSIISETSASDSLLANQDEQEQVFRFPISSVNDPVSEQEMITSDLCEEEQSELFVDSKEHLKDLCKDHILKINNYSSGDGLAQLITCDHHQELTDLDTKITQCIDQNNKTHSKLDGCRKTLDLLFRKIGMEESLPPYDDYNTVRKDDPKSSSSEVLSKFDLVDTKISKCISSNNLTHLKIDNLQKSLDMFLQNLNNDSIIFETSASDPLLANQDDEEKVFRFPISSVNELNMLEQELQHNEILMSNLVAKFTKIGRDFGNKCAKKIAVKLMERIISARLLTQFTWTGRTSGFNNNKLPFITYSSIFSLCLQVISKFDPSFDSNACQNFLKNNILKHSSMRLSRKFNKKINRRKSIDETWCMRSKRSLSLQSSVSEQKSDTEEYTAFGEEDTVDSKENILNLLDVQKETNNNPEVFEEREKEDINHCFTSNSMPKKCDHESKLDIMDRKISQCIESNTKLHSKIDNMQETLNVILNKIGNYQSFVGDTAYCATPAAPVAPTAPADVEMAYNELDSFYFPITSLSDLNDLNIKLSISEEFEEKMINKFFIAAGNYKKMSTQRFGLEVVESMISLPLLMKFSWTGRSKSIEPKFAFMKYQYIINFLQKIISKVDKLFTQRECEYFLRLTVFKYINMRVARQRRKIKDPVVEYLSDQGVNHEEFDTTSFSIEDEDVPLSSHKTKQPYQYRHDSVADFPEQDEES